MILSTEYLEENPYYIIKEGNMFQVRMKGSHIVMATCNQQEGEEVIFSKLDNLLNTYPTLLSLKESLNQCEYLKVPTAEKVAREKQYKEHGHEYDTHIMELIKKKTHVALGSNRKRIKRKFKLKA